LRWAGFSRARVACAAALLSATASGGSVLLTVEEALRLAFPGCAVERETVFLTAAQLDRAAELAGERPRNRVVHPYRARRDQKLVGTAYFDAHPVRTQTETLMVVVDADGKVARVEVLQFDEPPEYLPRSNWYRQFDGRSLDGELDLRQAIRTPAGATLTARATTAAVRRALALHRVLEEKK
jgi:Na+-translocating ferredoxin:NAD+ oxidoreductase RnfG subunit